MKPKPAGKAKPKQSGKKYQPPKPVEPEDKEFMLAVAGRLLELQKQEGILTAELCRKLLISRYTYLLNYQRSSILGILKRCYRN